jgi:ParB-like chromosome segregation protein Spo0J
VTVARKRVRDLRPAPYNPREISAEALAGLRASMRRYGQVQLIVWNKRTRRVVAGHQRLKVLRRERQEYTQVVVVDLPPAEEKGLNLALNNRATQGDWTPAVGLILEEVQAAAPELASELLLGEIEIPKPPAKRADHQAPTRYCVLVECRDQRHQGQLLKRLKGEGFKCRRMNG